MHKIYPPEQMPYAIIVDTIREKLGFERTTMEEVDAQVLCLTEEVGEFAKAWRRFTGRARVYEDLDHVLEELADIIIATRVTFMLLGADDSEAVQAKLRTIVERGGR